MKLAFNKKRIISFLPFFGIAMLFWVSSIMTKKSSYSKDIWVEATVPDSLIILDSNLFRANITLGGKGLDLIFVDSHNKANPLKVQVNSYNNKLTKEKISSIFNKEISNSNIEIVKVIFNTTSLLIDKKMEKTVDLKFTGVIEFEKLFGLKSKMYLEPKEIKISGPKSLIKNIQEWETEVINYKKLQSNIDEDIKLAQPINNKIILNQNKVRISIPVEELTEKKLNLPIRIEGKNKQNVKIVPSNIEVSFMVGLSKYELIDSTDFTATVHLDEMIDKGSNYPVSIIKKPSNVGIQYIRPNYVDVYLQN